MGARQKRAQFGIAVPAKKVAKVLGTVSLGEIGTQQPLNRFWNFASGAAIAHHPRRSLIQSERSA